MLLTLLYMAAIPLIAYSAWQIAGILVSCISRMLASVDHATTKNCSHIGVALLYPTCDDFSLEAFETLLGQKGICFTLFILDDSTTPECRDAIDKCAAARPDIITVVRRQNRRGFKGGNLNHWLHNFADPKQYPFFLVVDADERLPPTFACNLLTTMSRGSWAFVQAAHSGRAETSSFLQKMCNLQVDCIWFYEVPARQVLGLAPSLGHGILFRTNAVLSVGGFPPVVSEDLALTIRLAQQGLFGLYAFDVVGYEAFPPSYSAYWRRRRRWIQADAEIVCKFLLALWRSKLPLAIRLDLILRETRLAIASLQWVLLALVSVLSVSSHQEQTTLPLVTHTVAVIWLMPILVSLFLQGPTVIQKTRFLFFAPFLGMATSAINPLASIAGLMGRAHFDPTGMRVGTTNPVYYLLWETLSGAFFFMSGITSCNFTLAAAGLAVICSPLMRSKYEVPVLTAGALVFWTLIAAQIFVDAANGATSLLVVVALVGLTLTLA